MKRILAVVLVAGMCIASLTGCGGVADATEESTPEAVSKETVAQETEAAEEVSTEGEAGEAKRIVFLVKNSNSDFFVSMGEYAQKKAEELGWTCEVLAPIKADSNEEQIQLLEQSLLDPPDAYCIVPADSEGITPAIEEINKIGIPIVNVNTRFYDENVQSLTFVAIQNYEAAQMSARAGADLMEGKGKVLILEGTTGSQTSIDRSKGAMDAFAEFEGIEVLEAQTANYARQEALTVTQNLLQKYPEVNLIWAAAGEMALGAAEAVKQAGREEEVKIVTINAFKEMIEAVIDERVALTVDDAAWLQGETAITCLDRYWNGETLQENEYIDAIVVGDDNMDTYKEMFHIQ